MYTSSFGRCCGVSLSLCFYVRQLVCIILVFLFFKFLCVLVRPRPNVEPLRWIPSTVPEVRTAVQNFIILSLVFFHLGGGGGVHVGLNGLIHVSLYLLSRNIAYCEP